MQDWKTTRVYLTWFLNIVSLSVHFYLKEKISLILKIAYSVKSISDEQSVCDYKGAARLVILYMMEELVFDFKWLGFAISFSLDWYALYYKIGNA